MIGRLTHVGRNTSGLAGLVLALLVVLSTSATATAAVNVKLNFQPAGSTVPLGYTPETGAAFSATTGQGWVREDSLAAATHLPLSLTDRTRERTTAGTPLLNTFAHMETAVPTVRGAFEFALPTGNYRVTVGVGDSDYLDSTHRVNAEGTTILSNFQPTATQKFATAAGVVRVTDGRLTIDEIGGTNTKLTSLEIVDEAPDTTPPAAPAGLVATAGTGQISLAWGAVSATDLAGYAIYRSTTSTVATTGTPISGATLLAGRTYTDAAVTNGTTYHYAVVAVDTSGNRSPGSTTASATPTAPPAAAFAAKVNFQPAGAATPTGYTAETGAAYTATRGQGFVTEASLSTATHVGLDVSGTTRERNLDADQRLDTLVHLAFTGTTPAAWEIAVPNGDYAVTVAAGDPGYADSRHVVRVEGTQALDFTPTATARTATATVNARVSDGRLTLDGIGGTNTKLLYVDLATAGGPDRTPPTAPTGLTAVSSATGASLNWAANSESDLAGYRVFRSTSLPVSTSGTPTSGTSLLTAPRFDDASAASGTTYHYVVVAVDDSGNASTTSNSASVVAGVAQVDRKFNFQPAAAPTVVGYTVDDGSSFASSRGFGWVTAASLSTATHVPVDLTANTRDRGAVTDQRLDTLIHMQYPSTTGGTPTPGAWELVVPNGSYDVTVAVGDPSNIDSAHSINVEGQSAIARFTPTSLTNAFRTASTTVGVNDGRLTVDPLGGTNTKINYITVQSAVGGERPSVRDVSPPDGAINQSRSRAVTASVNLPNVGKGVDSATLNAGVRLEKVSDGSLVPANLNTSGGGDVIVLQPKASLAANTQYRFTVSNQLKDLSGAAFLPKTSTFTTGTAVDGTSTIARFTKTVQTTSVGELSASVAMGPDDRLYATTLDGKILRFPVAADGTLGTPTSINTIIDAEGGPRHVIGLAFDPASTASAPIVWVTHSYAAIEGAPDWTGKVSRLSGTNLSTIQDWVVGLPRSVRDHETNSLAFGPDGALYVAQGSNSAGGSPDAAWGNRPERTLSAAVLRLDVNAVTTRPLNVKTAEGGTYNPFATGAPLTVWASGVRNAFDLVWHRNGQLYVPVNGTAAGGNTPAAPATLPATCTTRIDAAANGPFTGPKPPAIASVDDQPDLLLRPVKGGYYGHPNPARCEYTFFGGNPTSSNADPLEAPQYPVGTLPDRNFRGASRDLGLHYSPNGAVEYRGAAFGGALNGKLLVARYSAGDDLVALTIDPTTKEVTGEIEGIPGLTGFKDPLDVIEDRRNGNLYVTELPFDGSPTQITLIRPDTTVGVPVAAVTPTKIKTNAVVGGTPAAATQNVTIRNTGAGPLGLTSVTPGGPNANQFTITLPALPSSIPVGGQATVGVKFTPTSVGVKTATLVIATNAPAQPSVTVTLRGLGTAGEGGSLEPSLQRILDLHEIGVNVGDNDPATNVLPDGALLGQEIVAQTFRKTGIGETPVTVEPLAVFGPTGPAGNVGTFGYSPPATGTGKTTLLTIPNSQSQTVAPQLTGAASFDPGAGSFGLWASFAAFSGRTSYTQNALNTPAPSHQARTYQLRTSSGAVVPDAYVVVFEDVPGTGQDFNDVVMVVRGLVADGTGLGAVSLTNTDRIPSNDLMVFSRIGSFTSPPPYGSHDRSVVRIRNTGSAPLTITGVPVTGPFQLIAPPTFPQTLAGAASLDVTVQFTASSGSIGTDTTRGFSTGTLTVQSNSVSTPSVPMKLSGYWQQVSENDKEPLLPEIVKMFGYTTKILNAGQQLDRKGKVETIGDEVLVPYWRRLDASIPVRVSQMAAYHGQGTTGTFGFHARGATAVTPVVVHTGNDAQSLLPRANGSSALAAADFSPTGAFGFRLDAEWSDPTLNDATPDFAKGCTAPCGHHVRVWPVFGPDGTKVAGSYIIGMDYLGINYDYNDNLYLVTNIRPDTGA